MARLKSVPNGWKPAANASSSGKILDNVLALIEASDLAGAIRRSLWLYPTINVLHVLGVMVLFAAVAAMDVRILRNGTAGARAFVGRIRPWAIGALVLQVATGFLLFVPEATHIGGNTVLQIKLGVIVVALLNVVGLEFALKGDAATAKAAAVASLVLWLLVATLGRLIAYF
jgi:hypothetical protein